MTSDVALGVGASLLWLAILAWSDARPDARLWPPRYGNWFTAAWAWGLTVLIYVGLIRSCTADWNPLDLPVWLRWALGGGLSTWGSIVQTRGIAAIGLKGTSGWTDRLVTDGVHARWRNPQYAGQIATLVGIAIFGGTVIGWVVVATGTAALIYAARVEDRFLAARFADHADYAARVGAIPLGRRK